MNNDLHSFISYKQNNQYTHEHLMNIRFTILNNILNEIKRAITLHEGIYENETDKSTSVEKNNSYSPISFLCSSEFNYPDDEPCKETYKESSSGRRNCKCNIVFEIVNELIKSELYLFGEKKLFHTKVRDGWKRKIFIHAVLDTELGQASAAAASDGSDHEWRCQIYLNPDIITKPYYNEQLPLTRGEHMKWAESWMGNHTGKASWQTPENKKVFGVDLGNSIFNKLLNHPIFENWDKNENKIIELRNILSIILLLEHELWHVAFGMYDPDENSKEEHELAIPTDIGFNTDVVHHNNNFLSSEENYEGAGDVIPGSTPEEKTQRAFTDESGHGRIFSQLAWFGSRFRCQLSPFDMFEEVKNKERDNKKSKKNKKTRNQLCTKIIRKELNKGGIKSTSSDGKKGEKKEGGRKKRRKKRQTKRTRKKKKSRKSRKKKRTRRRKTRRKSYSSSKSSS